ncbi:MAG: RnfABCDGE type electron transport complex subunit D [Bacteroidales bacterium]|nr:RnfABCDGE type electron transport complex subunit D [Bacteroidales bacterium]MBN2821504.1 RnfABCDGE type electron transport complex subunit D [Bacteroidales bacterium]
MSKLITVSPSPHIHSGQSVEKLMYGVVIAMMPAMLVSFYFFGLGAIYVTLLSVASCVGFEYLIQKFILKQKPSITDGSAIVTGILLAFNLPSSLPPFIIIVGALLAIGVGKMTFGGLGNNPFNPALVGRVFLLLSFPTRMTKYPLAEGFNTPLLIPTNDNLDAVTGATPLGLVKEGLKNGESITSIFQHNGINYTDFFMGSIGGSLGEIAAFALIIGLVYMLIKKIITWHIPVSIVATIAVFTGILWGFNPESYADPLFHILTGGVLLGAIFMATDYVTSPMNPKGQIYYGIGIGVITVVIRVFGVYPEGVSFAILIMNGFTPLINRYVKPRRFGKIS